MSERIKLDPVKHKALIDGLNNSAKRLRQFGEQMRGTGLGIAGAGVPILGSLLPTNSGHIGEQIAAMLGLAGQMFPHTIADEVESRLKAERESAARAISEMMEAEFIANTKPALEAQFAMPTIRVGYERLEASRRYDFT